MIKSSKQRECIRRCLTGRTDHPTADTIYHEVRAEYPKISLGTVYRNLAVMAEQGEILRISCGEGLERFDATTEPHYHYLCRNCGCVGDLMIPSLDHINVLAANGFDGTIESHEIFFKGLCPSCKKALADGAKTLH